MTLSVISEREKRFRIETVQAAMDNNRLEGMIVDEDLMALFNAWIENKMTFEQVELKTYEICKL